MGNLLSSFTFSFLWCWVCFLLQMKLPFVVQRLWDQYSRPNSKLDRYRVSFKSSGMSSPLGRVSLMKEEDAEQFKKKNKLFLQDIHLFPFIIFRMLTSYYVVNTSLQIIFCFVVFIIAFFLILKCFFFFFTILYWFCIHWHESTTGVHELPTLNPPPFIVSLGHPSAPAPRILYPVSNLD